MILSTDAILAGSWSPPATLPAGKLADALEALRLAGKAAGDALRNATAASAADLALRARRSLLDGVAAVGAQLDREPEQVRAELLPFLAAVVEIAVMLPREQGAQHRQRHRQQPTSRFPARRPGHQQQQHRRASRGHGEHWQEN